MWQPDLICWQASDKETDLLMSSTMQLKLKYLLPSTHQKQQVSYIEIYFGYFWKMRILSPRPSMIKIEI